MNWFSVLREDEKNMLIRSLIKRYRYIKALDKLTFPEKSIPIRIVLKGRSPAGHRNDVIKKQGKKVIKEWYEVAILTEVGNEFNAAVHEVRHRVQLHTEMPLFTKDKLIRMQKKHPQEAIQQIIDHLEVIEKKYQESLPEIEQDAIIVSKLIEQKCRGLPDPLKTASERIKTTP